MGGHAVGMVASYPLDAAFRTPAGAARRGARAGTLSAVTLHPLAEGFASVADRYERGRPDYPPAVAGALAAELGLGPGSQVLDLAAGTGKLTRALVGFGLDVTAIEPQESLRDLLAANAPGARVLAGVAEELPLADASIDAVTVADAFHWFDQPRALAEMARVLRPGGGLALVVVVPDWRDASWGRELGELISSSRPAHPHFDGKPWQEALLDAGGWAEPWEVSVIARQRTDAARLVEYVGSFSWIARLPADDQRSLLERVRSIIDAGDAPALLPVRFFLNLTRRA
jgi:SAM-dependent methyltransferase